MTGASAVHPIFHRLSMRYKKRFGIAIVCLLTFATVQLLFGQATGSISGTVTDPTGAAVPGAKVTVTAPATGLTRSSTTNDAGEYIVPLLGVAQLQRPSGAKGLSKRHGSRHPAAGGRASGVGFQALAGDRANQRRSLGNSGGRSNRGRHSRPGNYSAAGRRSAPERPRLRAACHANAGHDQETNPNSFFNGGPSSEASARGSFSLSVGGSRANSTDWLLDGNDNNELTAGAISILSSIDSIQEFKVLTYNYSAEWGTRGGPTVLVTTKSGTDQFHGSLFEFLRNTDLDARSFFAASTEKFNLNQFGASLGGPIKKDKTFFFADYEQKYQRHGIPFTGVMPTAAAQWRFQSRCLRPTEHHPCESHATRMRPVPFMCSGGSLPPPPAESAGGTPATHSAEPDQSDRPGIDQPVSFAQRQQRRSRLQLREPAGEETERRQVRYPPGRKPFEQGHYLRAVQLRSGQSYVPGGAPGFAEQGAFASNQSIGNHARNAAISETHIFSPNTVNQFSAGFNRIFDYITSQGNGSCYARALGIPGAESGRRIAAA